MNEGSLFGDQTVAKLDNILDQIQDIKRSVDDMDADLYCSTKKFSRKPLLPLNPLDLDSTTGTGGADTSPPTPTLEWDSNDIRNGTAHGSLFYPEDEDLEDERDLSRVEEEEVEQLEVEDLEGVREENSTNTSDSGTDSQAKPDDKSKSMLRLELENWMAVMEGRTPSVCSSGKGSMLSSPEQAQGDGGTFARKGCENKRNQKLHDLIKEAQRLGLLNDLRDLLVNKTRDSAFYED